MFLKFLYENILKYNSGKIGLLKNLIYLNIYNNLIGIYKSKGTEKSFRNLIRCFGIDDELVKIRLYTNNQKFEFKEN